MSDEREIEILVELLRELLGDERKHYESKGQISFDCPVCAAEKGLDKGDGKGNLEINYIKHIYKCWSCGETHETHGGLGKLISKFGSKKQRKLYDLIKPEELKINDKQYKKLKLPEGFTLIKDINRKYPPHLQGLRYLEQRGVTKDIIEKYNIGLTTEGNFANRIIIPSYDVNKELNYFIARAWGKTKFKYMNPEAEKDKIIFNEHLIDWDKDIYVVEGAFDSIFLDNSVPMLGKTMSKLLFETIYTKAKGLITICLDGDAWENSVKLYRELNGGILWNRIKVVHLPLDKDIADLRGNINDYYVEMKA